MTTTKFTLRDAQQGIGGLIEGQNALMAALQQLLQKQNATEAPATTVPQRFISDSENHAAERAAANLTAANSADADIAIPLDQPTKEGPVWASNTLRNAHGVFPKSRRRKVPSTGELNVNNYDVSPANRSHFMAETKGRQLGLVVTMNIPDGKGGEKVVNYPAVCSLAAKQFSSYDHGLYGKIDSVDITLPDGSEFTLSGQVNMQLKKRKN